MKDMHGAIRECKMPKHHNKLYYFMVCNVWYPFRKYTGIGRAIEFTQRGLGGYSKNDVYFTEDTFIPLIINWMTELYGQHSGLYYVPPHIESRWITAINNLEHYLDYDGIEMSANANGISGALEMVKYIEMRRGEYLQSAFRILAEDLNIWEI